MNSILHQRQLEEVLCRLVLRALRFQERQVTMANSGLPYPIPAPRTSAADHLPGVPLGSFAGSTYDEVTLPLHMGDLWGALFRRRLRGDEREQREFTPRPADVVRNSRS